eukprot:TRINITY_DN1765_c0_g1_i5.p1 TRINITY_DN1765_c0_g1~~TRINITY_DN1765_c0_g1_i5.p1  ORF type:complete len:329 (+),score=49.60 TRINITY_DN1765_c0_g1_i5:65-1051(+)
MATESVPNWELSFYAITHVTDSELLVRPLTSKGKARNALATELASPVSASPRESPTLQRTHGHKPRALGERDSIHGVRLEPIGGAPHSTRTTHHASPTPEERVHNAPHNAPHGAPHGAEWRPPKRKEEPKRTIAALEKVVPRHTLHWSSLDEGNHLFDFLSPARGKVVSTNPAPKTPPKSYMRSKSTTKNLESPPKHRGRSAPLPDLFNTGNELTQTSKLSFTSEMKSSGQQGSPLKGKLRPSYVKLNLDDLPVSKEPSPKVKPVKKTRTKVLSAEEELKKSIREQFLKYDLNGDGFISRKEAALLLQQNVIDKVSQPFLSKACLTLT